MEGRYGAHGAPGGARPARAALFLGVLLLLLPAPLLGQGRPRPERRLATGTYVETAVDADRQWKAAQACEASGDWRGAIDIYQALLAWNPARPGFVDLGDGRRLSPAVLARERLLSLPATARNLYRTAFEGEARALLSRARNDAARLAAVADRYPATATAVTALERAAARTHERGDVHEALALTLRLWRDHGEDFFRRPVSPMRLLKVGVAILGPDRALALLAALESDPRSRGKGLDFAALRERIARLPRPPEASWSGPGGDATQARVGGGAPVPTAVAWAHANGYWPRGADSSDGAGVVTWRGSVLVRDPYRVYGLDRKTGKLLWLRSLGFRDALSGPATPGRGGPGRPGRPVPRPVPTPPRSPRTGGEYGLALAAGEVLCTRPGRGLYAFHAATGKPAWHMDLPFLRQTFALELAGDLGPNLIAGRGVLYLSYVTHGFMRQVFLLALGLDDRRALWSAYLMSSSVRHPRAPGLALAGTTVVMATNQGGCAGVDSASGQVRWVRLHRSSPRGWMGRHVMDLGGTVALAPADGDFLLLVRPDTGAVVARLPRSGGTQALPSSEGGLLVLGSAGLTVLSRTGRRVRTVSLDAPGRPVGLAAVAGRTLFLPLAEAVLCVDTESGETARLGTGSAAMAPGHLVALPEGVVCATGRGTLFLARSSGPSPPSFGEGAEKGRALAAALASPSWARRIAAHRHLAAGGEDLLKETAEAAGASDAEVAWRLETLRFRHEQAARRARWTRILGPERSKALASVIASLLDRDPRQRWAGIRRLKGSAVDALDIFRDLLADGDEDVSLAAAVTLFQAGDRTVSDRIARALDSDRMETRHAAVQALAESRDRSALPALEKALFDGDPGIRYAALDGLAHFPDAVDADLLARLARDPEVGIRSRAMEKFWRNGGEAFFQELVRAVREDPVAQVRLAAVRALTEADNRYAAQGLAVACNDKTPAVRTAASVGVFSIAQSVHRGAVPVEALAPALAAPENEVRYTLVQAVAHLPGRAANGLLLRGARDKVWDIAFFCLQALLNRRDADRIGPAELPALAELASHKEARVRFAAVQVIGKVDGPYAGVLVGRLLADKEEDVREKARQVLEASARPSALAAACRLSQTSPRAEVRKLCAEVMARAPGDMRTSAHVLCLKDPSEAVRAHAAEQLQSQTKQSFGFRARDPSVLRNAAADRWIAWNLARTRPGLDWRKELANLRSPAPAARWRAARALKGVPIRAVVEGLLAATAAETTPWVMEETVRALRAAAGVSFGLAPGYTPAQKKAALAAWKKWWQANKRHF